MRYQNKIIPIRDIAKSGVIADIGAFDLGDNQLTEGKNVRIESDYITSVNGWKNIYDTENSRFITPWWNRLYNSFVEVRESDILWYRGSSIPDDVTPVGGINNSYDWFSTNHGEWLILINKGVDSPIIMTPNDGSFIPLENFPENELVQGMVSYNSHLVAWGVQTGAEVNPYLIHWSDALAPNSINPSWDITDKTSLSGTNELAGGNGRILTCEELANKLYIYQQFGVSVMQWVGGTYIFSFDTVFQDDGLLNDNSVCTFENYHFCIGQNSIYIHNGSTKRQIAESKVEREFFNTLTNPESVKVVHLPESDEIWTIYSDNNDDDINRVMVYNYTYNAFTFRELPTGTIDVIKVPKISGESSSWDSSGTEQWNTTTELWQKSSSEAQDTMIIYHQEDSINQGDFSITSGEDGESITSYIQQSKLDLESLIGNSVDIKMITAVYPQITGEGVVKISVGGSNTTNGAIGFDYVQDFTIGEDLKVDVQCSYRYLAIKYELQGIGKFNLSGHDIQIKGRGRK